MTWKVVFLFIIICMHHVKLMHAMDEKLLLIALHWCMQNCMHPCNASPYMCDTLLALKQTPKNHLSSKIIIHWSSRRVGLVAALLDSRSATCGRIKVTASVTDPHVHAVVGSFLVLDPHSWNFAPFNSIYTKSRKILTAKLHMLLKLHGRKRGDWASEELVHEDTASVERAFPLDRVSLQLMRDQQRAWTAW